MKKNGSAFWVPPLFNAEGEQTAPGIDDRGREVPDPVPMVVPVLDIPPQNDILQTISQVLNSHYLRQRAEEEGFDTPEEADDFADEDDEFELTAYQKYLLEKDLNPTPHPPVDGQKTGQGKPGGVTPPPVEVSKPLVAPVAVSRENAVSSVVDKTGSQSSEVREG